jgi:hypothetical protein
VRERLAGALIGVVFGVTLCWSGMSNPDVIRQALLFEKAYLFLFFAAAVLVAAVGIRLVRRFQGRARPGRPVGRVHPRRGGDRRVRLSAPRRGGDRAGRRRGHSGVT